MHFKVYNLLNQVLNMVLISITNSFSFLLYWFEFYINDIFLLDTNEIYVEFKLLRLDWNKWRWCL